MVTILWSLLVYMTGNPGLSAAMKCSNVFCHFLGYLRRLTNSAFHDMEIYIPDKEIIATTKIVFVMSTSGID